MPVIPNVGEYTVCELNRDFLTLTSDADVESIEAYSKILGRRYPSIPFDPNQKYLWSSSGDPQADEDEANGDFRQNEGSESNENGLLMLNRLPIFKQFLSRFKTSINREVIKKVKQFQGVSWHKHKQCLAFISGGNQVCVYDFEESDSRDPVILSNESQRGVTAVAWRPNAGMTLSVACRGGICIWTASYPGTIAPVRSGIASFLGAPSGSTGVRWALVDFLETRHPVTSITWNPSGRLLASASWYDSEFTIWDVAQGIGTPLRRGFGGVSFLQWSWNGDYLLSTQMDGVFRLWETDSWTSEKWSSTGGPVVSAMWGSDGAVLLMAFDQTTTLGALHFAAKPPSLEIQLLPVELPDIDAITGGRGRIEKMAWDSMGERLVIAFSGGDENHSGLLAVYDTRKTPILAVSLMGFIRGPGNGAKALSFGFYDSLEQGVLLAVCWSTGLCCTYPLLFKSGSKTTLKFQ